MVITGMSGAGGRQFGNTLEDLGWFVIDNLPPELIPKVADLALGPRSQEPRVALAVGAGQRLRRGASWPCSSSGRRAQWCACVFLDAVDRDAGATLREHQAATPALRRRASPTAIEQERDALLQPVRRVRRPRHRHLRARTSTTLKRAVDELFGDGRPRAT